MRQAAEEALRRLGPSMAAAMQAALVMSLKAVDGSVRWVVAELLTSAQQSGLRFYLTDRTSPGRLVSNLSATAPFPDLCQQRYGHRAATLVPPIHRRILLSLC